MEKVYATEDTKLIHEAANISRKERSRRIGMETALRQMQDLAASIANTWTCDVTGETFEYVEMLDF
jgi:hypothetical protein